MPRTKTKKIHDPTFSELIQGYTKPVPQDIDGEINATLDGLEKLAQVGSLHEGEDAYWDSITALTERYFALQLSKKYAPISTGLVHLTRSAKASVGDQYNEDLVNLQIPLFAIVPGFREKRWEWSEQIRTGRGGTIKISADTPYVPAEIMAKGREAMAYSDEVRSKALRERTLGDLIAFSGKKLPMPNHDLSILWIPRDEDLAVDIEIPRQPDPDPALVLGYRSHYFLVDKWNIKEERPLDHYLREYSGIVNLDPFKATGEANETNV